MNGWLVFAACAAGYLFAWRIAARTLIYTVTGDRPDNFDFGMGVLVGALVAILFPIVIAAWAAHQAFTKLLPRNGGHIFTRYIIGEPAHIRDNRLRNELYERDQRIAELERELGIPRLNDRRSA